MKHAVIAFIVIVILVIVTAAIIRRKRLRAKIGGNPYTHRLLPAGQGPHGHMAALNPQGTGESTTTMGHEHSILSYVVNKSPTDGHTHGLAALPTKTTGGHDDELYDEGEDSGQIESETWTAT